VQPLFELGSIMATRKARSLGIDFTTFLRRHATGDWGDVDETIARANDDAVRAGRLILSSYDTPAGRFVITTAADRSKTGIKLSDEK
jgi:hypothetical protein